MRLDQELEIAGIIFPAAVSGSFVITISGPTSLCRTSIIVVSVQKVYHWYLVLDFALFEIVLSSCLQKTSTNGKCAH